MHAVGLLNKRKVQGLVRLNMRSEGSFAAIQEIDALLRRQGCQRSDLHRGHHAILIDLHKAVVEFDVGHHNASKHLPPLGLDERGQFGSQQRHTLTTILDSPLLASIMLDKLHVAETLHLRGQHIERILYGAEEGIGMVVGNHLVVQFERELQLQVLALTDGSTKGLETVRLLGMERHGKVEIIVPDLRPVAINATHLGVMQILEFIHRIGLAIGFDIPRHIEEEEELEFPSQLMTPLHLPLPLSAIIVGAKTFQTNALRSIERQIQAKIGHGRRAKRPTEHTIRSGYCICGIGHSRSTQTKLKLLQILVVRLCPIDDQRSCGYQCLEELFVSHTEFVFVHRQGGCIGPPAERRNAPLPAEGHQSESRAHLVAAHHKQLLSIVVNLQDECSVMFGKTVKIDAAQFGISLEIGIVVGSHDNSGIGHVVGMHQIFAEDLMIVLFEELVCAFHGCIGHTLAEQLHRITMTDDEVVGPCRNADTEAKNRSNQMLHRNINTFECV